MKSGKYNISFVITQSLLKRKSNEEVLKDVRKSFPNAGTTLATIQWYRTKLRQEGNNIPTSRELKKEAKLFEEILL